MSLEFRVVKDEVELERCQKLRHKIFSQAGYWDKNLNIDNKDIDIYDLFSVHFFAYEKNTDEIVGTIRLILKNNIGFPLEDIFNIDKIKSKGNVAEVSRRVTLPGHVKANLGLLKTICQYAVNNDITDFVCSAHHEHESFYTKFGMQRLSDPIFYPLVNTYAIPMHIKMDNFKPPYDIKFFNKTPDIIF